MPLPRLPAAILHWNNPAGALRTARSMRAHAPFCDVTILENGSEPAARAELERGAAELGVPVLPLDRNRGFTGGMNFAVLESGLAAGSELALLSSHGIEVTAGCVEQLCAAMASDPRAGLLAPRIPRDSLRLFGAADGARPAPGTEYVPTEWTSGALILVRVEAFRAVGGFDDRFFAYYEDVDLGRRLRRAGWNVGVVPDALFLEDSSTLPGFGRVYLISRNAILSAGARGRPAQARQAARTALASLRAAAGAVAPWRSAERRSQSWLFARGQFLGLADAIAGVTGPGRAVRVMPAGRP